MEINQEFLSQIKKRDRKTILKFYEYSFNLMMQQVNRYTKDKSVQMSIVNDAFMKIINGIDKFDVNKSYSAWLSTILRNEFIDHYRKNKKFELIYSDKATDLTESAFTADYYIQQFDKEIVLSQFVDALPEATKIVFNLFVLEDMSREDISKQLGISYETVKWHILKARKIISEQLIELNKDHAIR